MVSLMTAIAAAMPATFPHASAPPVQSLYRFSIEKHEELVRSGVFAKRDRVIEVADSSLDDDRNLMTRVYGGGGIGIYWVVNLVDGQV
jgi:hypothetical protein